MLLERTEDLKIPMWAIWKLLYVTTNKISQHFQCRLIWYWLTMISSFFFGGPKTTSALSSELHGVYATASVCVFGPALQDFASPPSHTHTTAPFVFLLDLCLSHLFLSLGWRAVERRKKSEYEFAFQPQRTGLHQPRSVSGATTSIGNHTHKCLCQML